MTKAITTLEVEPIDGIYRQAPGGTHRDGNDHAQFRHARETHEGFPVGIYLQPPPMLFTRDGHSIWLGDIYCGRCAFLIMGGPSFKEIDSSKLNQPGFVTMSVNNSVKTFRPDLWTCVDSPDGFMKSIWLDPKIMKIVPFDHADKTIFDNEKWVMMNIVAGECPNTLFYRRNEKFIGPQWLFEDTFNWGNHKKYGGGRSVMLPAVRLLFYLGIRKVFLLGCDFSMSQTSTYHFEQSRALGSVNNNMNTYQQLKVRFAELRPIFERHGFQIWNCNERSQLKAFPYMSFEEALKIATEEMPDIANERTEGLYERKAQIKKQKEKEQKEKAQAYDPKAVAEATAQHTEEDRQMTATELATMQVRMDECKQQLAMYEQSAEQDLEKLEELDMKLRIARANHRTAEIKHNLAHGIITKGRMELDALRKASEFTSEDRMKIKKQLDEERALLNDRKEDVEKWGSLDPQHAAMLQQAVVAARTKFRATEIEKNKVWGIVK